VTLCSCGDDSLIGPPMTPAMALNRREHRDPPPTLDIDR